MRALDIALALILLQACIGLVNSTGLFGTQFFATPENAAMHYEVANLTAMGGDPTVSDYIMMLVAWSIAGFLAFIQILLAIVFIWPTLVFTFGVPLIVATGMQGGIWFYYWIGWAQWKANRATKTMD